MPELEVALDGAQSGGTIGHKSPVSWRYLGPIRKSPSSLYKALSSCSFVLLVSLVRPQVQPCSGESVVEQLGLGSVQNRLIFWKNRRIVYRRRGTGRGGVLFTATASTDIYSLSLHDALPILNA